LLIDVGHHPLVAEGFPVHRRLFLKLGLALLFVLVLAGPVLAASASNSSTSNPTDWKTLAIAFTFLLPVGLILLGAAAFPEKRAVAAATGGLVAWGLATLAYFVAGFAFQFGGIAVFHDNPDLAGLYWEYSLLDITWGTGWGMIGLKGFLLLDDASTAGALTLFLSQLPLLGVAALIPYFALHGESDLPSRRQLDVGRRLAGKPGEQPGNGPRSGRRRRERAGSPGRGWRGLGRFACLPKQFGQRRAGCGAGCGAGNERST
jgi:hypothetical protein